jgi:RNA-directed DNA polymerase
MLLQKYGGGENLSKIVGYFMSRQVEPNSQEGYKLMKEAFKKFRYQVV